MNATTTARTLTRAEYHRTRRDLHRAAITDRLEYAARRREDAYADFSRGIRSDVACVLMWVPSDVAELLSSRDVPPPTGRLPRGPLAQALFYGIQHRRTLAYRRQVVAEAVARSNDVAVQVAAQRQLALRVAA